MTVLVPTNCAQCEGQQLRWALHCAAEIGFLQLQVDYTDPGKIDWNRRSVIRLCSSFCFVHISQVRLPQFLQALPDPDLRLNSTYRSGLSCRDSTRTPTSEN